jgi:outer membrane protein OmpA-like peptidoglycan-associated protein
MTKTVPLLQLTMALGLAFGLSACQTVSDMGDAAGNAASSVGDAVGGVVAALDPTTWFGGNDTPPPTPASDTDASTSPDLANLPARPQTATPAQQQAAAQSLAADGAQARYSADALRAGTEAAAAPPPAADIPPSAQIAANNAPPSAQGPSAQIADNNAPPSAQAAPPSAQPTAAPAPPAAAPPSAALAQGTAAVPTGQAPVQTASIAPSRAAAPPPGAEPAVPANTPVRGAAIGSVNPSDAALGFRPSSAPPLDASINQWVSAPIVARYRQTASNAGVAPAATPAVPAVPAKGGAVFSDSGDVVANLDAISTGPAGSIAAMNGGAAPTAVVYFPGDGTTLSTAAKTAVKNAVTQFKSMGGAGSIRVVGHASSRTANMPVEKHLELIFDKSQQRANAVAQELIHEGIPADRVLIEAVGDSQPVYYESMPQGEEGNRRAEIFVQ